MRFGKEKQQFIFLKDLMCNFSSNASFVFSNKQKLSIKKFRVNCLETDYKKSVSAYVAKFAMHTILNLVS